MFAYIKLKIYNDFLHNKSISEKILCSKQTREIINAIVELVTGLTICVCVCVIVYHVHAGVR